MTKLSLSEVRGPLADFTDKLSGENGEGWLDAFKKFLRKENPWAAESAVAASAWTVWKTVTLGNIKTLKACLKTFETTKCQASNWVQDILKKVSFAKEQQEIELVRVTVGELGFSKGASLKDIYARAAEKGLDLCPAEVGPALRLAYKDQPSGEWLLVAMKPETDSGGGLFLFRVNHDGDGLWLRTHFGYPGNVWLAECSFVFVRRK